MIGLAFAYDNASRFAEAAMRRMSPKVALFGHGLMSDLSPLSGAERKLAFGTVKAAFDPERTHAIYRRLVDAPGKYGI
jgi:hypothetical protein